MRRLYISVFHYLVLLILTAFNANAGVFGSPIPKYGFVSVEEDFPVDGKNRRKWDAPVVADLDQDGWPDLLINDHGYSVQVSWNNEGQFLKPVDLFMGDLHGVTVGDYDQDGLLEIIISRGGGSGANARNAIQFKVGKEREIARLSEFDTPLMKMRGRTVKLFDPDQDGDLDLINFAFPSKEKNGQSESYLYENNGKGQLIVASQLPATKRDGQKTLITDFNNDTIPDLLLYGHGSVKAYVGDGKFNFKDVTGSLFPTPINHVTSIVEIDYDNDGDFDLYFSRGEEFGKQEDFYDATTKTWGFYAKRGPFVFPELNIGDVLQIENYQSPWPNKKIHVGESAYAYPFEGEKHSGKDVELISSSALGWPDVVDKKGLSVGYVGNENWLVAGDTFSPLSLVVRNVKNKAHKLPISGPMDVLLENRDDHFVDVTKKANLDVIDHGMSAVSADFDNNGYPDLLVIPRGHLVIPLKARLWLNQGNGKFEEYEHHGIVTPELGAIGIAVQQLDYNLDGQSDVVVGHERGGWHLFKNTLRKSGNYSIVDLGVLENNAPTTLGAIVEITACGETRIQRNGSSGAAYSRTGNRYMNFGLGKCKLIDQVTVTLTNGDKKTAQKQGVNKVIQFN